MSIHKPLFVSSAHTDRVIRILLVFMCISAALGLVDSLIIHIKEIAAQTDPNALQSCAINDLFNCVKVAQSRYSKFWGIPVSLIGIMYDQAALMIGVGVLSGLRLNFTMKWLISLVVAISLFFSYRLLYYSYFGIGAICPYCLVSNISTTFITLFWFWYLAKDRRGA